MEVVEGAEEGQLVARVCGELDAASNPLLQQTLLGALRRTSRLLTLDLSGVSFFGSAGVTGTATPDFARVADAVARIKRHTELPVVVGFGVKTGEHAAAVARGADGVVVGSAIVDAVARSLDAEGRATERTVPAVRTLVGELAAGVRSAPKAHAA